MEDLIFPVIAAMAVAMGVYSLSKLFFAGVGQGTSHRLKNRLQATVESQVQSELSKSIRRRTGLDEVQGLLGNYEVFHEINKTLLQSAPNMTLKKFLYIVLACGVTMFLVIFLMTTGFIVSLVAALLGGALPFLVLMSKRNKRQRLLSDQLPDALDFMGRAMRAGHSMPIAFQMMGEELPEPMGGEFRRIFEQHSLGASIEDALHAAVIRVESTDFAFFVTSALIQRQTGGDLSEVLGNITDMIRARVRLQQQVKSKTAEGRFTGYILAAFPAVMFVVSYCLNKEYAGRLLDNTVGILMLGGAFGLQLLGLFVIRKITTVTV